MKINKAKLLVGTLAIAAVAATAGSISGTIAWYQYSTRVTAAYVGTSAKCSEKLLIKVGSGDYKTDLSAGDIKTYLDDTSVTKDGSSLSPVTSGAMGTLTGTSPLSTTKKFKAHPTYQYFAYSAWKDAEDANIVEIPLTVKLLDVDSAFSSGANTGTALSGKSVWLNDLEIKSVTSSSDLNEAIRVHFHTSTKDYLLAKTAGDTIQNDFLDLNNDGIKDNARTYNYDVTSEGTAQTDATATKYGDADVKHTAYAIDDVKPTDDGKGALSGDKELGVTNSSGELAITVTIWLEGWAKLGTTPSSIWDVSLIGQQFQVGMEFAVSTL